MYYGFQGTHGVTAVDQNAMGVPMPYPTQQHPRPTGFYTMDGTVHHQHRLPQLHVNVEQQSLSNTQIAPWNHTVPLCLPWFQSASPFPAGAASSCVGYEVADGRLTLSEPSSFNVHCKRKGLHLDEEVPVSAKQFISEEAMALRMTQLKIGSNSADDQMMPMSELEKCDCSMSEDLHDLDPRRPSSNIVVLAPEIKELEAEPILPKSILDKLQKPTMELMIWKPPAGIIDEVIRATLSAKDKDKTKVTSIEEDGATNECNMDEDADGKLGSSLMDVV